MGKVVKLAGPEAGTVHWLNECIERGKRERFSEEITLTPGLAGELLRRNPDNRNIRSTKVAQFTADMRAGRWALNGETFKISKEGLLNDGQNRASAVIEANCTIPAMFVFGLERDSRITLDQGGARSAADYLTMQQVENSTANASIARLLIGYERSKGQSTRDANYVTNAEILTRVHTDRSIGEAAHFAASHSKSAKMFAAPAVIGFCYYLFADINPLEARAYMTQVCEGEGLAKKDPAYTVRERLLTMGKSREPKIYVIIRGWNAFRQGRKIEHTKINATNLPALV